MSRSTSHRIALFCPLLPVIAICLVLTRETRAGGPQLPEPLVRDDRYLPEPPRQQDEWAPPECELPDVWLRAARILFRQGFADPRGCEYRAITVPLGKTATAEAVNFETHGWLMPPVKGDKRRFAVCWNGLVYPVLTVGQRADLEQNVEGKCQAGLPLTNSMYRKCTLVHSK